MCINFLRLFVLIKADGISGYPYFSEAKKIEKLDIHNIRSKSQIPLKIRISDPCPALVPTVGCSCVKNDSL